MRRAAVGAAVSVASLLLFVFFPLPVLVVPFVIGYALIIWDIVALCRKGK